MSVSRLSSSAEGRAEIPVGGLLQTVELQGLNGPARSLKSFIGKPLIINVWASWCGPCQREMQSLERLAWRSRGPHFLIIGISTDDYPDRAQTLLARTHATISQYIDVDRQMETMLGASRLPLTVFISPEGRLLRRIYGARDWDDADSLRLIDDVFQARH